MAAPAITSHDFPIDIRVANAIEHRGLTPTVRDWLKAVSLFGAEHPATLGCLLALVREAWADRSAYAQPTTDGWVVEAGSLRGFLAATEADALVAALESAHHHSNILAEPSSADTSAEGR